ncbi:uncharacterized protein METZ01_LOCUS404325 [marine metagenome]|uniref:Uncharacterized protein n=1 Tax=marine metagenome TaxID=408172 RepID=A0A382W010_9ZZZZ
MNQQGDKKYLQALAKVVPGCNQHLALVQVNDKRPEDRSPV